MHVIITACTNKKRHICPPDTAARNLPYGSLEDVVSEWKRRVASVSIATPAQNLYSGRAFSLSKVTADLLGAQLYVISAGLGFVRPDDLVAPYDLTVSPGSPDFVLSHVSPPVSSAAWWAQLVDDNIIHSSLRSNAGLILIALSSTYLEMVEPILEKLADDELKRLRIFTGSKKLPLTRRIATSVVPYDERLDGPESPFRGTKIDFASRALWHFAETVLLRYPRSSFSKQAKLVETSLGGYGTPKRGSGSRCSDPEIKNLLRQHWESANGSSTKLLRVFRDELSIACEQKRFSRLAAEVRNEEKRV